MTNGIDNNVRSAISSFAAKQIGDYVSIILVFLKDWPLPLLAVHGVIAPFLPARDLLR